MNNFADWSYCWFGCWSEFGIAYKNCPSIKEFLDPSWSYKNTDSLKKYLTSSPVVVTTSHLSIPWAIGSGDGRSSLSYRSDDTWLWFDDIDYYLSQHYLRLPDRFLLHIEEHNYIPPKELKKDYKELPWPPEI
ncbi:hypothetical protein [Chamaesiphon sp.]|uniref:hypothetical protein n=1 Tax=Chamaesiphon sp. TaxID=2814140 RepID=UPI0035934FDA